MVHFKIKVARGNFIGALLWSLSFRAQAKPLDLEQSTRTTNWKQRAWVVVFKSGWKVVWLWK